MAKNPIWTIAVCSAVIATVPSARAQDTHVKIYAGPAYVAPMQDSDITLGTVTDTIKSEDHVGWNLGVEGRGKVVGVELDYVNADQDVKFGGSTIGDTTFSPLTATVNFHVIPTKVVDFYFGPSYTWVNWGDIHLNATGGTITGSSGDLKTDSAHNWGVSLGLDFGIGKHFAISTGLKYLNVDLQTSDGTIATDVKPLVARIDAAIRF